FYAGWNPSAVPEMYDAEAYAARFAREAIIAPDDVGKAAAATTAAVLHHLPPPQMDKAPGSAPQRYPHPAASPAVNLLRKRRHLRGCD
ncbi:MAG: hypothetical protein ACLP3C_27890, partial [Mycobacterium sp.]